jgi:poly-gamma-glutamate capsule biosynthesis protein CapA/YwtB (metallophosphatase superfamily)
VANNHAWDYGSDAFTDTVQRLSARGISAVGAGREPVIRDVRGTHIAFLAYTDLLPASACHEVNCYDAKRMTDDIEHAQQTADVVVVSFHTGEEYVSVSEHQRVMYHAAIDAGADMVVGHHPHVVQELEQYRDRWIAYSLGNFVFDQTFSSETLTGMLLDVSLSGGRILSVIPRTVRISSHYQPALLP